MTDNCLEFAEKLKEFFNSSFCDSISTENLLHAWIEMNGADDIYFLLNDMRETVRENKPNLYSSKVKESLRELNKTICEREEAMWKSSVPQVD